MVGLAGSGIIFQSKSDGWDQREQRGGAGPGFASRGHDMEQRHEPRTPPRKKPPEQPTSTTPMKTSKGSGSKRKTATTTSRMTRAEEDAKDMDVEGEDDKQADEDHWWYDNYNSKKDVHWRAEETEKAYHNNQSRSWGWSENYQRQDCHEKENPEEKTIEKEHDPWQESDPWLDTRTLQESGRSEAA